MNPDTSAETVAVSRLQALITNDANIRDEDAFPPLLNDEHLRAVYTQTYNNLQPNAFCPSGTCAVCALTFPSMAYPAVSLNEAVASNDPLLLPHLSKLRWRHYNRTLTLSQLGFANYHRDPLLVGLVLDRRGVLEPTQRSNGHCLLTICSKCRSQLKNSLVEPPQLALANNLWTGDANLFGLPALTWMEAAVIAKARTTSCILKLKRDKHSALGTIINVFLRMLSNNVASGIKGHMITFGQKPETIFEKTSLPGSADDLPSVVHIIFVYQKSKPNELPTLQSSKNVLSVNRNKIYQWLCFLKQHNPLYANVVIDHTALSTYPDDDSIPTSLHQSVSTVQDIASADTIAELGTVPGHVGLTAVDSAHQFQQSMVYENTLHYQELYGSIKEQLSSKKTTKRKFNENQTLAMISGNQFFNSRDPAYYASLFPVLFPLGIGAPLDNRPKTLALKLFVKRSLSLSGSLFRTHALWMFLTYDQLRQIEIFSTLKLRLQSMPHSSLARIESLTLDQIQEAVDLKNNGLPLPEGHHANSLMNAVRLSGGSLQYTQQFRSAARDQIRATIVQYGSPSLYITISPADHKHILSYAMALQSFDLNADSLPNALFDSDYRSKLAAEHPVDNSEFFHVIIREILGSLFGFKNTDMSGIFGPVTTYYGMVESQNRGTLHIHMLLWLKNAPSPDALYNQLESDSQFKDRLFQYLDSIIHQDTDRIPKPAEQDDGSQYPVAYGPILSPHLLNTTSMHGHLHAAIKEFQTHVHMATCFKNNKTTCRMRKPSPLFDEALFDSKTGEINQRRVDGMINSFNAYLTLITNSNTDIQFLLKTKSCLSVMYYITNYITKDTDGVSNYFAVCHAAKQSVIDRPITTAIEGLSSVQLHVRALLIRIHGMLNSANQVCSNVVATLLLDLPMCYKFNT
jgi:hypothetical protein